MTIWLNQSGNSEICTLCGCNDGVVRLNSLEKASAQLAVANAASTAQQLFMGFL